MPSLPAGTYCPGMNPSPPPEFGTCLGDLYSVAWMENAEHADLTLGGWVEPSWAASSLAEGGAGGGRGGGTKGGRI